MGTEWVPHSERWDVSKSDPSEGVDCFWLCRGAMVVTAIEGPQFDERQAKRAHLMAAAPELYEALEAFATHFGPLDTDHIGLHPEAKRCFTLARAALAKARGET